MENMLYYTADCKVNGLLNSYVREALFDDVSLSIDGIGLQKTNNNVYNVLSLALESVYKSCLNHTVTNNRYVKVRTMYQQNQIFIKLLNSCEEDVCIDKNIEEIEKIVKKGNGYFRYKNEFDESQMYIALPMK